MLPVVSLLSNFLHCLDITLILLLVEFQVFFQFLLQNITFFYILFLWQVSLPAWHWKRKMADINEWSRIQVIYSDVCSSSTAELCSAGKYPWKAQNFPSRGYIADNQCIPILYIMLVLTMTDWSFHCALKHVLCMSGTVRFQFVVPIFSGELQIASYIYIKEWHFNARSNM